MKVIRPFHVIEENINGDTIIEKIERAGRTCYKSEASVTKDSGRRFVQTLINLGHESVLEHEKITVRIICDRGVSHEIVRHRIASYSQESTRYCNYAQSKFGEEITVIEPFYFIHDERKKKIWEKVMVQAETAYLELMKSGASAQEARSVLPNSLKTEIVITMNLREWRHFFRLRSSSKAHPQMQEIARPLLDQFKQLIPVIFDDITY